LFGLFLFGFLSQRDLFAAQVTFAILGNAGLPGGLTTADAAFWHVHNLLSGFLQFPLPSSEFL
jgi:hypothetical protein